MIADIRSVQGAILPRRRGFRVMPNALATYRFWFYFRPPGRGAGGGS